MDGKSLEQYPEIMTAAHIAEYLQISRRRVYELLSVNNGIPCIQIGITKRVKKSSFELWLNKLEKKVI
ncbi:helix-turn-helix domain-containing protein [Niallia taxi]|uniref:helix-turn-helix domain-containing protein n=1 Tax=Niallia taxi TaxID=2499688 RepID=UPI00316BAB92